MIHCRHQSSLGLAPPLALATILLSCGPDQPPPSPPLEVEYSGCSAFYLQGPVCALWPGADPELKLWVKADPGSRVEIHAGSERLKAEGVELGGGWRYRLSIPPQASRLTVSVVPREGVPIRNWSLRLAPADSPAWSAEIKEMASRGDRSEVRKRLQQLRRTAPPKEQGLVLRSLAYLARAEGDAEQEEIYLHQGWSAERAEKRWSGEVDQATRLARLYLDEGRFSAARQTLAALRLPPQAPADAKYLMAYYQGWLSDAVGDYRSALKQLRKADLLAERVGMAGYRWDAEQVLARILQDLGRSQEASQRFARLLTDLQPRNPCDLGTLLTNAGWARLRAREAGETAEDPTSTFEQARAQFDEHRCLPGERLNARLNLALAHQQASRWLAARRALRETRMLAVTPNLRQRLWWDDLEARMAIAEGHPERALGLYEKLERTAALGLSLEGRLRALLGQANSRLALGQRAAAIAALAEADRRIDEQSWLIPAHEGRDTFLAQREAVTRLYLELLLAGGRREEAFSLARRARSRLLRQLTVTDRLTQLAPEERRRWEAALSSYSTLRGAVDRQAAEEWQLAKDEVRRAHEAQAARLAAAQDALDRALASLGDPGKLGNTHLSPPRQGEVILAYHPLRQGWVGFAATQRGIDVATFDLPDGELSDPELTGLLLAPFSDSIRSAERVRVLPYGRLRAVDFHALPFEGEPLLARHIVVYSLDLPTRSSPALPGRPIALLVSDPEGDLPAARQEAATVATTVRGWGSRWGFKPLNGPKAQAGAVRAALPAAGLFHYAGHGVFAGFAGWSSALPLADGSRLTLGDVLALRRAPAWVVLSACDAGRSSEEAPGEGIGLANAFLLAGSQGVVAARRPVADRSTRDLMRELYRGWQPGKDLARQLQRTQLAQRLIDPSANAAWASFRLLVP
jgi:CHAT domain-containing protein